MYDDFEQQLKHTPEPWLSATVHVMDTFGSVLAYANARNIEMSTDSAVKLTAMIIDLAPIVISTDD